MQADYDSAILAFGASCIGYWPLTEASGTSFADSKASNTATVVTSPTRVTGPDGSATGVDVAATANKVALPGSNVSWPESYSVCFWAKLNSTPGSDAMAFEWNQSAFAKYVQFDIGDTSTISGFSAGARSVARTFYGTVAAAVQVHDPEGDYSTGTWKFVVVTFDNSLGATACKVYVDGTVVSVTTGITTNVAQSTGAPGAGGLGIGGRNNAGTRQLPFDGALNGFALLSGVLSSTQVASLRTSMLAIDKTGAESSTATDGGATVQATVPVTASETAAATDAAAATAQIGAQSSARSAFASEAFTGSDGTTLHTHDARWVAHPATGVDDVLLYNGQAEPDFGATSWYYLNEAPPSADYAVQGDFQYVGHPTSPFTGAGVMGRMSSSATTGYYAILDDGIVAGSPGHVYLYKYVAGTATQIGSANPGISSGHTYTLRLEMVGSSIVVKLDGTQIISVTDTSITAAGFPGLQMGGRIEAAGSHTKGFRVDNWTADAASTTGTDTAAATDAASVIDASTVAKTASDTAAATDAATLRANVGGGGTTALGTSQGSGAPQTVIAGSGSGDGLNYNAFPGLCEAANGNLVATWHHANNHIGDVSSKVYKAIGTPDGSGGYTWGAPSTLASSGTGNNSGDMWCVRLANNDILTGWNESTTPGTSDINTVVTVKILKSTDNGATFPTTVYSGPCPGFATNGAGVAGAYGIAPNPPIQLPSGRLLLPIYGFDNKASLVNEYAKVFYSDDSGATWTYLSSPFPHISGQDYDEGSLLLLDNGDILAASRTFTSGTGQDIYCNRSTDNGATWTGIYRVLGTGSSTGFNNRTDLVQTPNGGVLLRTRYMNAGVTSWPCYHLSTDRGLTFGMQIDPYDGVSGKTGAYTGAGRGGDVSGAFARIGSSNTVAYLWGEELGASTSAVLYFRVLTVTGGAAFGGENASATDAASVTVGIGTISKTGSDNVSTTEAATVQVVGRAVGASDSATGTESSGLPSVPEPVAPVLSLPLTANFVSRGPATAEFVSRGPATADFVAAGYLSSEGRLDGGSPSDTPTEDVDGGTP